MRDHVQYHNPVKNDPLQQEDGYFSIYTTKAVAKVDKGDRVWVVTSSVRPRRYFLLEWFTVADVEENMPADDNIVSGSEGEFFRQLIRIDDKAWFPAFLHNQGNFGRGFSPITERHFIKGLESAARSGAAPSILKPQSVSVSDKTVANSRSASGQGFGDPLGNGEVERAAISFVTSEYAAKGWAVRSVESENRGFDLSCTRGRQSEHVEVKGIQGTVCSFVLTANEHRAAQRDAKFVLIAVTDALGEPATLRFTGRELLARCLIEPMAFRVRQRGR